MQSPTPAEDSEKAPPNRTTNDVPQAIQRAAQMVLDREAVEEWPGRAIALRDLCRAVFATDGRIAGLRSEAFSLYNGTLLFRGVSFFKYVRANLNGDWIGTGFMSDGNYYAVSEARADAIDEYGFSHEYGWATAYKLTAAAALTTQDHVERISLNHFIAAVGTKYDADADALAVLYERGNDNGLRAVLLGYDGMADPNQGHHVIYNHRALVYHADCTPWARGIEPFPEELLTTEQSKENPRPQPAKLIRTEYSRAQLMHELSRFQSGGMDRSSDRGLKYATAAGEVRQELTEMRS